MARMQLEVEKQIKKRKRASSPPSFAITVNESSALAFISLLRSGLPGFFDRISSSLLDFARFRLILFEFARFYYILFALTCSALFLLRSTFFCSRLHADFAFCLLLPFVLPHCCPASIDSRNSSFQPHDSTRHIKDISAAS